MLNTELLLAMLLIPLGYMGWRHLQLTLLLIPAALLGYFLAVRYAKYIPKQHLRAISLTVCAISGMTAVATALF